MSSNTSDLIINAYRLGFAIYLLIQLRITMILAMTLKNSYKESKALVIKGTKVFTRWIKSNLTNP